MWFYRSLSLIVILSVAACGFEPLYQGTQTSRNPGPQMTTVKIESIADRPGQVLRNQLVEKINPNGEPQAPAYYLDVDLTESIKDLGIERDTRVTFSRLRVDANFRLRRAEDSKVVFQGLSQSAISFNLADSPYARFSAENDARNRALQQISDDIFLRLGIYFKTATFK